jgi:hypothetical protein
LKILGFTSIEEGKVYPENGIFIWTATLQGQIPDDLLCLLNLAVMHQLAMAQRRSPSAAQFIHCHTTRGFEFRTSADLYQARLLQVAQKVEDAGPSRSERPLVMTKIEGLAQTLA